jgi:hypothetical protein
VFTDCVPDELLYEMTGEVVFLFRIDRFDGDEIVV